MNLLTFLNNQFHTAYTSEDELPFRSMQKTIPKGTILTDYGKIERNTYFINNGIIQVTLQREIEEKIIDFFFPESFVCSYTSFILQIPSDVRVSALTDCEVEVISHDDIQLAYNDSLFANKMGRILTEQIFIIKSKREKDFLTKSAEERYEELVKGRPDIIKLIPGYKIAQYLGIKPESLSRIRKDLSHKFLV
jgi:CRP-like cAMP-binding protein